MNISSIYTKIKKRWSAHALFEVVKQFENASKGAATGGEGLGMEMQFFRKLESENKEAFDCIKDLNEKLIVLCNSEYGINYDL
jgi:hypothetical protein